ncbi:putative zinc-finger of transcription factor IIIC complex-domain-containing protein [Mycena amicta]|nr:putative zinc-finger of transcription factor IIIC complex-domain-containing protein [Mycena amicta]
MPSIYTSLNVPVVAALPSATNLQWSADGQACFLTKTSLYIMTPDHGLNFRLSTSIKAPPPPQVDPIGWFRTLIQFDRPVDYLWPEHSQNWSAIVLGTLEMTLWAATLSPSGISANANCIFDITPFLLDYFSEESNTVRAIRAQVTSIHWSPQTDFGIRPAPLDGSLLVAGNRAGMLLFFRYRASGMELVKALAVSEQWIVRVAVSPWRTVEPGKCQASVAFATDDGIVAFVRIEQVLEDAPTTSTFGFPYTIRLSVLDDDPEEICSKDSRPARGLQWVEPTRAESILVYTKPGSIGLWRPPSPEAQWSGAKNLTLRPTPKLSSGTSSLYPATGLVYLPRKDALLISLADGSIRALHGISEQPSWEPQMESWSTTLTSESLSRVSRLVLARTEPPRTVDPEVVARVSGMASYDGGANAVWIHEVVRPGDFSYKHDARHNNVFIVARLWNRTLEDDSDAAVVSNLAEVLRDCRASSGLTPAHLLRPTFLALTPRRLNDAENGDLHAQLLVVLSLSPENDTTAIRIEPWTGGLSAEMRREFRDSIARHLFGWDGLLGLRLRLGVADFIWKNSDTQQRQADAGVVASSIVSSLSHGFVRTIVRHLIAAVDSLESSDVPFVLRMVMHTMLTDTGALRVPQDLNQEGELLAHTMANALPSTQPEVAAGLNESCPACRVEIPFREVGSAVCAGGHHWGRCSITTFILSSPRVRTCVGCGRKAFLPPSTSGDGPSSLPPSARGWVVEELLEAVQRCLFCGNSFVSVL